VVQGHGSLGKQFEAEIRDSLNYYKTKYPVHFFRVPDYRTISRIVRREYRGLKRPCDFIVNINGVCSYWELKQTSSRTSFRFDLVKEHQIEELRENHRAGGTSYILIKRDNENVKMVYALSVKDFILIREEFFEHKRKSIKWNELEEIEGVKILRRQRFFPDMTRNRIIYGWNLDPLLFRKYSIQKGLEMVMNDE